MVAHHESAALAQKLIEQSCARQGILRGQLTLHADRGSSMRSKPVALLLSDLGVTKTHSRPYVSNDNPFSGAQFKTMKYRPEFPDRFGSIQDSRGFGHVFFPWYNTEHRHSGLGMLTPHDVHYGLAEKRVEARARVLAAAFAAHPERFVAGQPRPAVLPTEVWINKPKASPAEPNGDCEPEVVTAFAPTAPQSPAEDSTHTQVSPDSASVNVSGSIGGQLLIAPVAPLNTEDLNSETDCLIVIDRLRTFSNNAGLVASRRWRKIQQLPTTRRQMMMVARTKRVSTLRQRALHAGTIVLLPLLFTAACAGVRVRSEQSFVKDVRLTPPPVLVVYDFAVSADDLAGDVYGQEFAITEESTDSGIQSALRYSRSLSERLVENLNGRGIKARSSDDKTQTPMDAIVLTGQFASIDPGSRLKRWVIGFGAGNSEMRVQVQAYQVTAWGLMKIAESEKESQGSMGFGLVVPAAVSVATGGVGAIAIASSSLITLRETRTGSEADARRIAGHIAERIAALYKNQGWL